MCIIDPWDIFYFRNKIAGQYRVKINGTDKICLFEKQEEKQPDIVFSIKRFSFFDEMAAIEVGGNQPAYVQSMLLHNPFLQVMCISGSFADHN